MKPIPLTRRHHLQHFTSTLEASGFSSERILNRLNMPMWQYGDQNDLIPLTHVLSVLREASRTVGDDKFGLLVGEKINYLSDSTMLGAIVAESPTVYHAMQTVCEVANAHTTLAKNWLTKAGDTVWFCRSHFRGLDTDAGLRQHEQYVKTSMIGIVRQGAGPNWKPAEVRLCAPHQPGLEETDTLSGVRIHYGQPYGAIAVPRSVVCQPIRRNPRSARLPSESEKKRFLSTAPSDDFVGSLRQVIGSLLKEGQPSIETLAEIVGTRVRTFQRRLHSEKVTFRQLIDEARFDGATRMLEESDSSITDIAFDLGYGDGAHFTRAFRRWAAVSPREYRHLMLQNSNPVAPRTFVSRDEEVRSTAGIAPTTQT